MGGKQKQAQRVKNNARPSNSGRSAEFLGTASTIPPFSFSTMKEPGFTAASFSLTPIDDIDASVDSNFQLVLKKMNKKDATTKLKALQEFTELVKNTESEAVKAILPFWPRLYCALATDAEHRVREATHVAHNQVVLKAKRNLAPYLKQLAGPWFTSQYDTYAPASSAACRSFKDAFPINKLQEAIMFCQEEILHYIGDNLTVHTAQTLSNPKTTTADESKAKHERVLISSLQGYSLYFQQVSEAGIKKVEELHRKILSHNRFWKLARSDIPQIRASWFGVLSVICEKAGFLLVGEEANVVKAVFGVLDESDPAVQCNLWEAALLTTKTIENWWNFYNIEEKLLPKLWKVLREAGHGNATTIYPNLLPLISHLPSSLNYEEFLPKFFSNMKIGLSQNSARASQSESRAISIAFVECLQYTIMQNHENVTLCEHLIKEHLIPLIDTSLIDPRAAHKTLFNQVSSLVQYWHKNKDTEQPNYSKYLQQFWCELEKLFSIRITEYAAKETASVVSELAGRQIDLLVCLKHTVKPRAFKVQFTTEDDQQERKGSDRRNSKTHSNVDRSYLDALHRLVFDVCVFYIKIVDYDEAKKLPDMIEHVVSLAQEFESESFIEHLKAKFCPGEKCQLMVLFNLVFEWTKNPMLCRKSVVDLIFLLLKYSSSDETQSVLQKFIDIENDEALGWCISRALSYPHNSDKIVQTWLANEKIGEFLVKITTYEIADKSTPDLSLLLKQAFTETSGGELFITQSTIGKIIGLLSNCLLHSTDYTLTIDNCASLASYIASSVCSDHTTFNDELFLALFHLSCHMKGEEYEYLSKDTLWEVKTAWQDALVSLSANTDKGVLLALSEKCADILESTILGCDILTVDSEYSTEIITKYLLSVEKSKPLFVGEIFNSFFGRAFVSLWREQIYSLTKQVEYLKGNICFEHSTSFESSNIDPRSILKYFGWKLLMIKTLHTEINNEDDYFDDEEDEDEQKSCTNRILKLLDKFEDVLLDVLQDIVAFDNIIANYTHLKYYENLQDLHIIFTEKFNELFALEPAMRISFETSLKNKQGWSIPAYKYFVQMNNQRPRTIFAMLNNNTSGENKLHLIQTFSRRQEITFDDTIQRMTPIESVVRLRCLLHCEDIDVQIADVFGRIEKIKFFVGFDNWEELQLVIEISRLCTEMLRCNKTDNLTRRHWDFIVVSLGTWSAKLLEAKDMFTNPQVSAFITAISNLYIAIHNHIELLRQATPVSNYVDEWENVFVKSITSDLVRTWLYLSEKFVTMKTIPTAVQPFLQEFGKVIGYLRPRYVFDSRIDGMPKWSKLLKQCCGLLTCPEHALQLWGYHMLKVLSFGLVQVDAIAVDTNTPHEKGLIIEQFKDPLVETHNIVSTMLLDFRLGEDSCRVEPFTDSYTYTFAYLLLWDILLYLCEKSSTELRFQYADWLRKEDLLNSLLSSIFKLMPLGVFQSESAKLGSWFVEKTTLSLEEPITSEKIERLNCSVYASTLAQLPATVRQWWSSAEARTSQIVERVTATYISPLLCNQELVDVSKHENKFKNMIIKVHPSVREVVAVYTVDEAQMELFIALPSNYPLGGPDVQLNRQIGGLPHKQWLMQLRMCLLHQNGRIWDALSMWNNNLDKKFDGVEECYICFAVLHPGTYQLPKLSCKTCRKKFHAACLYKWFSTSNKSTCPICRNLF